MSRGFLCFHCWRSPAAGEAFYRCGACEGEERPPWLRGGGSGGPRPVAELTRSRLARLVSDDDARLSCRSHPDSEIHLFCECGEALSERAGLAGRSLGFGFAGPRSSGKTLLILAMVHELRNLALDGDRRIGLLGLGDTDQRFGGMAGRLWREGEQPHSTAPLAEQESSRSFSNFAWELLLERAGRRPDRLGLLAVHDLAGETWNDAAHLAAPRFDRYLGHLASMVLVIDGAAVAADLGLEARDAWDRKPRQGDQGTADRHILSQIADRLGPRARKLDVALAISKADLLWEIPEWQVTDPRRLVPEEERDAAIERLLSETRRRDLLLAARRHFKNARCFALSSLGFTPGPGDVDPENHLTRTIEPVGVTDPLNWLLGRRLAAVR